MVPTGISLLYASTNGGVDCSMNTGAMVQSTTRTAKDYFHFGLTGLGVILAVSGVVILSLRVVICGLVLLVLGLAYFVWRTY
jgi:hypothetical protein